MSGAGTEDMGSRGTAAGGQEYWRTSQTAVPDAHLSENELRLKQLIIRVLSHDIT